MSDILPRFFAQRRARTVRGMPFAEYQDIPAVNASVLKQPTRLEMKHYVDGMNDLPPVERALLEMTGANVTTVLERVAEQGGRTVPRGFARLVSMPDDTVKLSKAQRALLEACADEPVDTREFNVATLRICVDKGWITTDVKEVAESALSPQVKESRALAFGIGRATHTAILEPHMFDRDEWQKHYQLCPTRSLTSTQALAALEEDPSRELITPEMIDIARRSRDAVHRHKLAAHLLGLPGASEVTVEVWDSELGVMRKARIDRLPDDPAAGIIDVKTMTGSLLLQPVRSVCYKLGYGPQLAFYDDTLAMVQGKRREASYIIGVTKEPPFMARVFELLRALPELSLIERGREIYLERMTEFCLGYEEGNWSAYDDEGAVLLAAV